MEAILFVLGLIVITVLIFLLTNEKKKPDLGTMFWQMQTRTPSELAKSFAFAGETDRLIEMLKISQDIFPNALDYHAAAAKTIPMLYRNHEVSWRKSETIIWLLFDRLYFIPVEVTHAFVALGVGGYLGSLEEEVHQGLVEALIDPEINRDEATIIRFCLAVGYLRVPDAVDHLTKLMNMDDRIPVQRAARSALQNMGFYL
ncbi:MAG: hypothetical protein V2J07_10770 [Anaerolineae bacterium]|jgi:hypothetical protein|nr:hypothetical protein [Anaerolineae bacterium]